MSNQPPCVAWAEKLALRHEDLSPGDRDALEAHVRTCPACEATQADYRLLDARLRALPPPSMQPLPRLFSSFAAREDRAEQRIEVEEKSLPSKLARREAGNSRATRRRSFSFHSVKKLMPVAFVAILVLCLFALFETRYINTSIGRPLGSALYTYQGHTDFVDAVAWSPNGHYIASASWDHTVRVWDAQTRTLLLSYSHNDIVDALAWSPDGHYIASGSWDHTVRVWNVYTGALTYKTQIQDFVDAVAWSPDGRYIAIGGRDEAVYVLDAWTGTVKFTFTGENSVVNTVAWSPKGPYVAAGYRDGTVQIWDATTGALLNAYKIHTNEVRSLAWSPDGRYIASGSWDHTVRVWIVKTGSPRVIYRGHTDNVDAVAWSPDGRYVASGSWDYTVQVWQATKEG